MAPGRLGVTLERERRAVWVGAWLYVVEAQRDSRERSAGMFTERWHVGKFDARELRSGDETSIIM